MSVKFKSNIDSVFKEIKEKADKVSGNIPVTKILTDSFIMENTTFSSLSEFVEKGSIEDSDFENYESSIKLNDFVKNNTDFDSFEDLLQEALEQYAFNALEF